MRLIYLAGRYRSDGPWGITRNIEAARIVARELWCMGFAVLSPHCNTALMDGPDIPETTWLDGDLLMLERCDILVVMPSYEHSRGTLGEIEHARERGIPTLYWPQDREQLDTVAAEPPAYSRDWMRPRAITVKEAAAVLGAESHRRRKRAPDTAPQLFDESQQEAA